MAYAIPTSVNGFADHGANAMTIERLLQQQIFEPEVIAPMTSAYERARLALGLTSRSDGATTLLAQTVISVVEGGVRDPDQIFRRTMDALKEHRA